MSLFKTWMDAQQGYINAQTIENITYFFFEQKVHSVVVFWYRIILNMNKICSVNQLTSVRRIWLWLLMIGGVALPWWGGSSSCWSRHPGVELQLRVSAGSWTAVPTISSPSCYNVSKNTVYAVRLGSAGVRCGSHHQGRIRQRYARMFRSTTKTPGHYLHRWLWHTFSNVRLSFCFQKSNEFWDPTFLSCFLIVVTHKPKKILCFYLVFFYCSSELSAEHYSFIGRKVAQTSRMLQRKLLFFKWINWR